jgi:hypothetical protein
MAKKPENAWNKTTILKEWLKNIKNISLFAFDKSQLIAEL